MLRRLLPYRSPDGDRGAAMITAVLVMAVLAGLGVTVTAVSVANSRSAGRDRQAGAALALSEAGVAEAVEYIRASGVGKLTCLESTYLSNPNDASCANAVSWANPDPAKSQKVTVGTNETYRVWISTVQAPAPITAGPGTYRIRSEGLSGGGPGSRNVVVDVQVKPFSFPIGIFADSIVGGGGIDVLSESVFALTCVNQREKIQFVPGAVDMAYGIPAAVHSAKYITTSQHDCLSNDKSNIHAKGFCSQANNLDNDEYDQDNLGGDLSGTPCQGSGGTYPQTSFFDEAKLKEYGYVKGGLSKAQYDALKSRAMAMGTYFTSTSYTLPADLTTNFPNAVVFFDLSKSGGGEVHLTGNTFPGFDQSYCGQRSLILVVQGGSLRLNGQADLVGAVFVPDGNIFGTGGLDLIGTMFAKTLEKLSGQSNYSLKQCFFDNFPGPILELSTSNFREVDR